MLGNEAGVISGAALLVDYILTITVSIAACADAIFSYLPLEWQRYKLLFASILNKIIKIEAKVVYIAAIPTESN